jgi:RHS repeat-associated protein
MIAERNRGQRREPRSTGGGTAWQILETRQSDTESAQPETLQPKHQYVWSQRYIDAAVLPDENTGTNGLCDDQRLYYLNDANFNVTALLDTNGDALERYVYSPYGVVTIYDATWTNTRSESSYANVTLYTGREFDAETGLYYYRNRYYSAESGTFVSRDPIGYQAGDLSLYRNVRGAPTLYVDPTGSSSSLMPFVPTIKIVHVSKSGCVEINFGVKFQVPQWIDSGFIVQEINASTRVYDCDGNDITMSWMKGATHLKDTTHLPLPFTFVGEWHFPGPGQWTG